MKTQEDDSLRLALTVLRERAQSYASVLTKVIAVLNRSGSKQSSEETTTTERLEDLRKRFVLLSEKHIAAVAVRDASLAYELTREIQNLNSEVAKLVSGGFSTIAHTWRLGLRRYIVAPTPESDPEYHAVSSALSDLHDETVTPVQSLSYPGEAPPALASAQISNLAFNLTPPGSQPTETTVTSERPEHPPEHAAVAVGRAFPWITPSSEHIVQHETFDVEVTLRLTPAHDVQGSVLLPKDDSKFTLDVHLLFEDQSAWSTLEFWWNKGMTKTAKFLGLIAPKSRDGADECDFRMLRVNFYRNSRWCGEGLKYVEILSQAGALKAPEVPVPSEPAWRTYLNIASEEVVPPDLLVRIQEINTDEYQWSFLSPHKNFHNASKQDCRMVLKDGAMRYVKSNFEPLSRITLNELTMQRLEGSCKQIYDSTPPAFKDAYWELYHAAKNDGRTKLDTIQFVSDEPYVPWEIMQIADARRGPGIDAEILSVRHATGRWLASESCQLRSNIALKEMAIFASDYSTVPVVQTKLKWAEEEAKELESRYNSKPKATRYKLVSREVTQFLKEGKTQVVHFSCHGRMDQQVPSLSALLLEDDQVNFVPAVVITQSSQRGIGSQHPLVFLNACQVGGTGADLSFVTGWPGAFLTMGASAVIAPLWSVGDDSARSIAEQFYGFVINNSPISLGAALQNIRAQFKNNRNMTYLAYLLYGDPTAQISVD